MAQPDLRARLTLQATVSPSEDPAKVLSALRNIAGGIEGDVTERAGSMRLVTSDIRALANVRDKLRDRHVRSAARRQLLLNASRGSTRLLLNRQAAAAGVVAVCGSPAESPLGPIVAILKSERLQDVIDWLAAYTEG
ncbi:MAG: hypothetical protein JRM80_08025 [Nitrososphaerota archaeon]|nr:hypothetical protein [Nitrososphaerota archaeon]